MRIGNDFCKDLASVLTERADNELAYAKNLNKSSLRLQKLAKDFHGNLSDAWLQVSIQFDAEAEMHRSLGSTLHEEIVKPIKILVENNIKSRKPVELKVDKAFRNYADKKAEDYKVRQFYQFLSKFKSDLIFLFIKIKLFNNLFLFFEKFINIKKNIEFLIFFSVENLFKLKQFYKEINSKIKKNFFYLIIEIILKNITNFFFKTSF